MVQDDKPTCAVAVKPDVTLLFKHERKFLIAAAAAILRATSNPSAEDCVNTLGERLCRKCPYEYLHGPYEVGEPFRLWVVTELRDVIIECRFARGDTDATGELATRDHTYLIDTAAHRLGSRPLVCGAADAVNDMWVKLLDQQNDGRLSYDSNREFRPWAGTVLRNLIEDMDRNKKHWSFYRLLTFIQRRTAADTPPIAHDQGTVGMHDIGSLANAEGFAHMHAEERAQALDECLQELKRTYPEHYRVVIERLTTDRTFKAIADDLCIPLGTATSHFRRALAVLKACLTQKGIAP